MFPLHMLSYCHTLPQPCSHAGNLLIATFVLPLHDLLATNQSDQRSIGSSAYPMRKPSRNQPQQAFRRRSMSPECPSSSKSFPTDRIPKKERRESEFPSSTAGRVLSACAVCLGRHPHRIIECAAPMLWDNTTASIAIRSNRILSMRDGRPVCGDWQRASSCSSSLHDARHFCSGCSSSTHGAQECSRAQKARSANPL
jgi:hypothetical protein